MHRTIAIRYFDVAWLSHRDGPGHRVVLFLQGCHLRCPWCHSPHSQAPDAPLLFFPVRCRRCGRCDKVCTQSVHQVTAERHDLCRERCRRCGKCIEVCPLSSRDQLSGPLALPTREVAVSVLWELLYPQLELLRNIGGLTVSGGEPLLQFQAIQQLFHFCNDTHIHSAVETSGAVRTQYLAKVVGHVDCWLFGLRPTHFYVPPFASIIEKNLAFLEKAKSRVIVRTPIVSGITDPPESLGLIVDAMQAHGLTEIELLPFNEGTSHYYHALGISCPVGSEAMPSAERLSDVKDYFERSGMSAKIIY